MLNTVNDLAKGLYLDLEFIQLTNKTQQALRIATHTLLILLDTSTRKYLTVRSDAFVGHSSTHIQPEITCWFILKKISIYFLNYFTKTLPQKFFQIPRKLMICTRSKKFLALLEKALHLERLSKHLQLHEETILLLIEVAYNFSQYLHNVQQQHQQLWIDSLRLYLHYVHTFICSE